MTDPSQFFGADKRSRPTQVTRRIPPRLTSPVVFPNWLDVTSGNNGSVQILPQNLHRASLTIQNISTVSILYFSFGVDATPNSGLALGPGKGLVLDFVCPQDALSAYMDSSTPQLCVVMEITYA